MRVFEIGTSPRLRLGLYRRLSAFIRGLDSFAARRLLESKPDLQFQAALVRVL